MERTATIERMWMSYEQAAEYTGYDRTTLWRAVKRGELRIGAPRFERAELDAWLRGESCLTNQRQRGIGM